MSKTRTVIARGDRSRLGDHFGRHRRRAGRVIRWGRGRPGPCVLRSRHTPVGVPRQAVTSCLPAAYGGQSC
jgi:hypothetical protein